MDNESNLSGLSDFLLSDQNAGANVALGIGYVGASFLEPSADFPFSDSIWVRGVDSSVPAWGAI